MFKKCTDLEALKDFPEDIALSICSRSAINNMEKFFNSLMKNDFSVSGFVCKDHAVKDIENIIFEYISADLKVKNSYKKWVQDMANICHIFCDIQKSDKISFSLGTKRGCKRYHLDYVPIRLL